MKSKFVNVFISTSRERQTDSARLRELTSAETSSLPAAKAAGGGGRVDGGRAAASGAEKKSAADTVADAPAAGGPFNDDDTSNFFVNITHGSKKFVVGGLDPGMTVRRLKEGISRKAGVSVAAQKLM